MSTPDCVVIDDMYLDVAVAAAADAVAVHQQYANQVVDVEYKQGRDFRTTVDTEAEDAVRDVIQDHFPDHAILGEEQGLEGDSKYRWIVDPLDGTANYFHAAPPSCAIVALEIDDELHAGVIHDSWTDDIYYAVAGEGAYAVSQRDGVESMTPLRVSETAALGEALVSAQLVATDIDTDDTVGVEAFQTLVANSHGVRQMGCAGINAAHVAQGQFDAFTESIAAGAWDMAASVLLVREAGGRVTSRTGSDDWTDIRESTLIASNGQIHDELLDLYTSTG